MITILPQSLLHTKQYNFHYAQYSFLQNDVLTIEKKKEHQKAGTQDTNKLNNEYTQIN